MAAHTTHLARRKTTQVPSDELPLLPLRMQDPLSHNAYRIVCKISVIV
jgi:hypothetical protein